MSKQKKHDKNPDNQELAKEAAVAESEYETYKENVQEQKEEEVKEQEEAEAIEEPDEQFEEVETKTETLADGSTTITTTITTTTGQVKTTTHKIESEVKDTKTEVTGNVKKTDKPKDHSKDTNHKTTTTTKLDTNVAAGKTTEITKKTTDKVKPTTPYVRKENADGSHTAAPGQTKDMGLPSPKKEAEMIRAEAEKVFKQGTKYITIWIRTAFKIYMRLSIRWKQDEDNVTLQLEMNRARQRY